MLHDQHGRPLTVKATESPSLVKSLERSGYEIRFTGVEAAEGFIEKQQFRLCGNGPGQLQSLKIPVGQGRSQLKGHIPYPAELQSILRPFLRHLDPFAFSAGPRA